MKKGSWPPGLQTFCTSACPLGWSKILQHSKAVCGEISHCNPLNCQPGEPLRLPWDESWPWLFHSPALGAELREHCVSDLCKTLTHHQFLLLGLLEGEEAGQNKWDFHWSLLNLGGPSRAYLLNPFFTNLKMHLHWMVEHLLFISLPRRLLLLFILSWCKEGKKIKWCVQGHAGIWASDII